MTRKQAKELLPIITAFANGETIQCRARHNDKDLWIDDDHPTWASHMVYRIKPKPREWDVIRFSNGHEHLAPTGCPITFPKHLFERVRVREVLP